MCVRRISIFFSAVVALLFASLNVTASVGSFEAGGSFQVARIYFLGSGIDTYAKPHVDEKDPLAKPDCSSAYKYVCNAPKVGVGTSCDGNMPLPAFALPDIIKTARQIPLLSVRDLLATGCMKSAAADIAII